LVNATVPAVDRFGWTRFSAIVWTQVSSSVDTTAGAFMTVHTVKTSLSRATRVLLQTDFSYNISLDVCGGGQIVKSCVLDFESQHSLFSLFSSHDKQKRKKKQLRVAFVTTKFFFVCGRLRFSVRI